MATTMTKPSKKYIARSYHIWGTFLKIKPSVLKLARRTATEAGISLFLVFLAALLATPCRGQVAVAISPSARQVFWCSEASGIIPCAGGTVTFFNAGTSVAGPVYTDSTGTVLAANPVVLDVTGAATPWLVNQGYDVVLKDSSGVQQWKILNVNPYQIVASLASIILQPQTVDPAGQGGMLIYRSDIPCLRFFTTGWDCIVRLGDTQTLTNKSLISPTLTSPTMSNPIINGQPTGNAIQGTDNKLLTSSSIGAAGAPLCVDGVGGATSLGCTVALDADQSNLTANVPATQIGPAASANGFFRFSCLTVDTQQATTSSTLPACSFTFTQADTGLVASLPICASVSTNLVGDSCQQAGINFMNYFYVKSGSLIKYQTTGYASSGATALAYAVHVRLEGPF